MFQNIHLVKKWLPALEKKLEHLSDNAHDNYRVFMSAEPASTPSAHIIPQVHRSENKKYSKIRNPKVLCQPKSV